MRYVAYQSIPLAACAEQEIYAAVEILGKNRQLRLAIQYVARGGFFSMSISEGGRVILSGVPLTTGLSPAENLLSPYAHLGIGEAVLMPTTEAALLLPIEPKTLGEYLLLWGDGA